MNSWIQNWLEDRTQLVVVDGEQSGPLPVTSEVPQDSVMGPCLFHFFIDNMAEYLQSTICLFADDTIINLAVDSQGDVTALHNDLDLLAQWGQTWKMEFHLDNCHVLWVTNNQPPYVTLHNYILQGHTLSILNDAKNLDKVCRTTSGGTHILQRPQTWLTAPWLYSEGMSVCFPKPLSLMHAQPLCWPNWLGKP